MITVNSFTDKRFILNGVEYFRNYVTRIAGNKLTIYNVYDNRDVLIPFTEYSQFSVNSTSYNTVEELQSAIMSICYNHGTLGSNGGFDQNNVGRVIYLGYVNIIPEDTEIGSTTYLYSVAEKMSENDFTIAEDETPVIVWASFNVNGTVVKNQYLFLGGKGMYTEVNHHQLQMIRTTNLTVQDIQDTPATTIIDLGELTDGDYITAANSTQRDFTLSGQFDENGNIISYYFSYTQNEVLYFVQFVGSPSIYNSDLTESDLVSSTNSEAAPNITLQQITDNGNVTTNDIVFENSDSGDRSIKGSLNNELYNISHSITFFDDGVFQLKSKDNNTGNYSVNEINNTENYFSSYDDLGTGSTFMVSNQSGITLKPIESPFNIRFKNSNLTDSRNFEYPDTNGTIALKEQTVPLSGTEIGDPITGDLELQESVNIFYGDFNSGSRIVLEDEGFYIGAFSGGFSTDITLIGQEGNFNIYSENPNSKGLTSNQDFTANITALDYVQKKYIDDIPFVELDETSPQTINKVWIGSLAEYEALSSEDSETLYLKQGISETGWGKYSDSQYSSGSPFSIVTDTNTIVPNNSNSVNESQLPTDVATFTEVIDSVTSGLTYDYSKVLGEENDNLSIDINLKVIPTDVSATYIELWFNDGSVQENKHIFTFPKGISEVRHINFTVSAIISNYWDTNGGTLYARSNGSCDIYDVNWSVSRNHKAI